MRTLLLLVLLGGLATCWFVLTRDDAGASGAPPEGPNLALEGASSLAEPSGDVLQEPGRSEAASRRRQAFVPELTELADEGDEESVPLVVQVQVRESGAKGSAVVPGVEVVFGTGFGGTEWRDPAPTGVRELGRGRADDAGRLTQRVDVSAEMIQAASWGQPVVVFARVAQTGFKARLARKPLGEEPPAELELLLLAQPGGTVSGVVLASDGTPAGDANVTLFKEKEPGEIDYGNKEEVRTNAEGLFEAHIESSGSWQLQARANGLGVAGIRDLSIELEDPPDDLELVLAGPGVLAGRVVDPTGAAMRRYQLWAIPGDRREDYVGYYHDPVRLANEWEGGLFDGYATTDDEGRFRFAGLKQGSYHIRGTLAGSGYFDALLTAEPVPTGTQDLLFRMPRHRVVLSVRDESGSNVAFTAFGWPRWKPLPEPAVYVVEIDEDGRVIDPHRESKGRRAELEDRSQTIEVQPDKRYVFGVLSQEHALREAQVYIAPERYTTQVVLELAPARQPGTLELEVQDPTGEPYWENTRVLLTAPSGKWLFDSGDYHKNPIHSLALAPDVYEALVSGPAWFGHHGERMGRQLHSPVVVQAEVFAGDVARVPVRLGSAGWVALHVQLEEPVPAPSAEKTDEIRGFEAARESHGGIAVRFESTEGGATLEGSFRRKEFDTPFGGGGEANWVLPDQTQRTLDPLPTGTYLLHLKREGYLPKSVPLEILAGETVRVEVELELSGRR